MRILILGLFLAVNANAKSEVILINSTGDKVSPVMAIQASLKGETILRCSEVRATPNAKTGSITLKAKK